MRNPPACNGMSVHINSKIITLYLPLQEETAILVVTTFFFLFLDKLMMIWALPHHLAAAYPTILFFAWFACLMKYLISAFQANAISDITHSSSGSLHLLVPPFLMAACSHWREPHRRPPGPLPADSMFSTALWMFEPLHWGHFEGSKAACAIFPRCLQDEHSKFQVAKMLIRERLKQKRIEMITYTRYAFSKFITGRFLSFRDKFAALNFN